MPSNSLPSRVSTFVSTSKKRKHSSVSNLLSQDLAEQSLLLLLPRALIPCANDLMQFGFSESEEKRLGVNSDCIDLTNDVCGKMFSNFVLVWYFEEGGVVL